MKGLKYIPLGIILEDVGCRELEEECGLTAKSLHPVGLLVFEFIGERQLMEVHVFSTEEFVGTVSESEGRYFGA